MGTGMERGRGQRTERGDRVRPQSGRNCFPLGFSLAPKQKARARDGQAEGGINSPGGRRRRREEAGGERETESEDRAASGERQREDQRGLRDGARESRGWGWGRRSPGSRQNLPAPRGAGAPGSRTLGPHCPRRSLRPREPRWAVLRRHPAGWRREGKVRGSEAAAGSRTYVRSACWRRRCAELGDSGPRAPHIAPPARGRAGQGRLDCARRPVRPGFARVWRPELVPPLSSAHKPMARRPLPRAGLPRPRGWPPGRAGERGWGDWAPRAPQQRRSWRWPAGGALTLRGGKAVGNPNRGPAPPREDFRGKFSFGETINTPIGWQATLS